MQRTLLILTVLGLLSLAGPVTKAMAGDGLPDVSQLEDEVKGRVPFVGRLLGDKSSQSQPKANAPAKPDAAAAAAADAAPVATSMPETIDRGEATPRALIESMNKVLGGQAQPPRGAWLGFNQPASRPLAKEYVEITRRLVARGREVTVLVRARIGKMEADMIDGSVHGGVTAGGELTLHYQMTQIAPDGRIDWSKVKITENGDKAKVVIDNNGGTILLAKVDGKWYLGEGEGQETLAVDEPLVKDGTANLMKVLDQVDQKVKSGQITRKNFIQEYQDIVNSTMAPGGK